MKVATGYSTIDSKHNDLNGAQQEQQYDYTNAAVVNGGKPYYRTWMLMITIGMVMLTTDRLLQLFKVSGHIKSFGSDILVSDALRSTNPRGCHKLSEGYDYEPGEPALCSGDTQVKGLDFQHRIVWCCRNKSY